MKTRTIILTPAKQIFIITMGGLGGLTIANGLIWLIDINKRKRITKFYKLNERMVELLNWVSENAPWMDHGTFVEQFAERVVFMDLEFRPTKSKDIK